MVGIDKNNVFSNSKAAAAAKLGVSQFRSTEIINISSSSIMARAVKLGVSQFLSAEVIAVVSAPAWVPAAAKIQFDFVNNRAWVTGTGVVAINTLLSGAVLDAQGLVFTGAGAIVTATANLIAAAQLPYSAVFDQTYSDGNTLSGAETLFVQGTDSNHMASIAGNEVSLTTDGYDVLYLAANPAIPNLATTGKLAFTISNTKAAVSVNGDATTSNTSQTLSFGNVTIMRIWSTDVGQKAVGHIRSFTIYPVKSDSQLSTLST